MNNLEKTANRENIRYRRSKEALILNIPVPIKITRKGFIAKRSTVDFAGLVKGGTFVAYDAKQCASKTSFPLGNIKEHQLLYLKMVKNLGGIAFFMIHFTKVYPKKVYLTPLDLVEKYWFKGSRKSIPIKDFRNKYLVNLSNYLPVLIKLFNKGVI